MRWLCKHATTAQTPPCNLRELACLASRCAERVSTAREVICSLATVTPPVSAGSNNHVRGSVGIINDDAAALPKNLLQVAMRGSAALRHQ